VTIAKEVATKMPEEQDRETFSSPACSMHEFADELTPPDARLDAIEQPHAAASPRFWRNFMERRDFLRVSLTGLSAVATFFGSIPFVKSFLPSAKARALGNPIDVDLSKIEPGAVQAHLYRGEPILVLRRTRQMLATLATTDALVLDKTPDPDYSDPAYVDPESRSIDPEFLVVRGVCTHLGCVPQLRGTDGKQTLGDWWPGGFICPCHQSGYDYAGRVVRGPAPRNLSVPPYRFASPTRIVIGEAPTPT
jgi:ubiquinol-cytochrome c reductase iron-sulfur subunit